MSRILFLIFILGLLSLPAVNTISCAGNSASNNDTTDIPSKILRAADKLIVSKTGEEFFEKYITPDYKESKLIPEGFFMSYRFYMPERPYVDEKITFGLDSSGVVLANIPLTGFPDCKADPVNCSFLVDELEAVKIAEEAGLQKGIKDWGKTFIWNAEYNKYVWHIISTLKGNDGPDGFRGSGIEMVIDSNSGEILKQGEWNIR